MATKEVLVEAFSKKRSVKFVSEGEELSYHNHHFQMGS